jgi:hypothetical protein
MKKRLRLLAVSNVSPRESVYVHTLEVAKNVDWSRPSFLRCHGIDRALVFWLCLFVFRECGYGSYARRRTVDRLRVCRLTGRDRAAAAGPRYVK